MLRISRKRQTSVFRLRRCTTNSIVLRRKYWPHWCAIQAKSLASSLGKWTERAPRCYRGTESKCWMECVTNASVSLRCCTEDGSGPPEIGLQELASNRPVLLRSKGVVVSDCGK